VSKKINSQKPHYHRGNPPYYVPTAMLKDVLEPLVDQMGEKMTHEHQDGTVEEVEVGGIARISDRVPLFMEGIKAESVPRRLWSIMEVETFRTSTEIADSTLLAADVHIEDTKLPTFPAHIGSALEMVNIYNEGAADKIPAAQKNAFARQMVSFCKGFCYGLNLDADEIAAMEAAKVAVAFIRETAKVPAKAKRVAVAA